MKSILITAYDVNPYQGSESATGWNYPLHLAKDNKVSVVTRENNLPEVYRYIEENKIDTSNLSFIGCDLPYWARFWKKGARGSFLYFYLWQIFVTLSFFSKRDQFDICHGLNFHCDWAPSFLWLLGKPFVWGPINHNEQLPDYVLATLPKKELRAERVKLIFKKLFWNFDPFLFLTKKRADKILVGHKGVIESLNLDKKKCILFNQIATEVREYKALEGRDFNVLFIGRGLLIKNYLTVLEAVKLSFENIDSNALSLSASFIGVGKNAKKVLLERAEELNIAQLIEVKDWVEFDEVNYYYSQASVFCFPSFEGAGMVIAEALSHGVPVITIDRNGAAHELSSDYSFVIKGQDSKTIIKGISEAITLLSSDSNTRSLMSLEAHKAAEKKFSWLEKSNIISKIYTSLK
ncbi:hypothetical protein CJF42_12105 [Pseudoalteromonas sp. NBT06-2]|uniref:glycosyltransferase family 4 protein n=1 Tax=Pseudoalteromonas sp. NBT06-2 TaxID=2025950 RepID=UPI000BA6C2CD|nr:glycosyltransferase [Pseudoalteromonas sp. NBT06-2]PAJ74136.1 hypothetical protein CJF42_12105 [Pseudoalteromonas sp. NBT06-2]